MSLYAFSTSFPLLLAAWPIVAALLTLPFLAWQQGRHGRVRRHWGVAIYLFVLYLLGLITFTLLPLPRDFAAYCAERSRPVQMVPFGTVLAAIGLDTGDVAQVVLNVMVFIPLGIFARALFGLSAGRAIVLGLAVSLLIETTQVTALWGMAPCRYRVGDVDDVILNGIGTWVGVLIARPFIAFPRPGR